MKRTSIGWLVGTGLFVAAAAAILTTRFYGSMLAIPATVSISLWAMALVCAFLTWKVRSAKEDEHGIGLDKSQLNPLTIAQFLLVGKASAWTGAIVGGAYAGMLVYVLPRAGELVAASSDLAGVLTSALGGMALSVAGVVLERHCEVPPDALGNT
ncbi:TPA: DUF3180 domain-containing protein [Corynebacterium striatum]|uniref:DUF3180 domain-containing protein n=1 Tax=Corynebacterium TaxID=1716 RepID=UPI000627F840|nr:MULTISPECIES: DUF3180 domain-containing protein [Corynebacterium]KKO78650.1 hypothetical protein WU85_07575 [Corynebacterium striatum]MBD0854658.1 DUF3180 domain-containing protein [Corynebacterium striatum]MCG7249469.1 DUF3180 domain-containing protein [Corynebacterium striatum]MDK7883796.1 DUF3180 domain-containing protein [Corynebacterium striatum]MDK8843713.1 DUF3180 domain-containing protein [Corynebacterium striatum]